MNYDVLSCLDDLEDFVDAYYKGARYPEPDHPCKIGSKVKPGNSPQQPEAPRLREHSDRRCLVGRNTHTPIHTHTPIQPKHSKRSQVIELGIQKLGNLSKSWRNLWPHQQLALAYEAARKSGGIAFSLNLSPAREEFLSNRADPVDDLRRYIGRELRRAFGCLPPFAFAFEVSPVGKLHVHGVVILPENSEAAPDLRGELARAGGKIKGRGAARQVDLRPVTDGLGWAAYGQKAFDDACRYLGTHKVTFISTDLTRLAKEAHTESPQTATEQPCSNEQANTVRHKERAPRLCLALLAAAKKFVAGKLSTAD